jgi:nitrite reductase/ring-hydroxylating ferredoxin subunit
MEDAVQLCSFDDLKDGEARGFAVEGLRRKVVIVRKNGSVYGYLDSCPHYAGGTPMAWKTNAYLDDEGGHIACHSHGALFEIETGECVLGPCLGQSLKKVPLMIVAGGGIVADVSAYLVKVA